MRATDQAGGLLFDLGISLCFHKDEIIEAQLNEIQVVVRRLENKDLKYRLDRTS